MTTGRPGQQDECKEQPGAHAPGAAGAAEGGPDSTRSAVAGRWHVTAAPGGHSAAGSTSGFDTSATPHGSGLQNMADRLSALGGAVEIESEPGCGTTVTGRLPVGSPPVA